jgi:hypothetical protein
MCYICGRWWVDVKEYIDTGIVLYADGKEFARSCDEVWREVEI